MMRIALFLALALAFPAHAQDDTQTEGPEFTESDGAELRFLDKLTSETGDVSLSLGQSPSSGGSSSS